MLKSATLFAFLFFSLAVSKDKWEGVDAIEKFRWRKKQLQGQRSSARDSGGAKSKASERSCVSSFQFAQSIAYQFFKTFLSS